jgi:hypothetical protein
MAKRKKLRPVELRYTAEHPDWGLFDVTFDYLRNVTVGGFNRGNYRRRSWQLTAKSRTAQRPGWNLARSAINWWLEAEGLTKAKVQ